LAAAAALSAACVAALAAARQPNRRSAPLGAPGQPRH